MAMNIKKVVGGGILAGVVIIVVDFVTNYALGARMKAEADAFKPGMSDQMMQSSVIASSIVMDLVLGIALVFTYAAIRPRFGPGPRTAVYTALLFWLLGLIFNSGYRQMGMMSSGLWWTFAVIWLVSFLIASQAGAAIYSEDTVTA
jgi:FtsH-binding integral membrane protein